MKIRQNRKIGLGQSQWNPRILSGLVVQAADPHWETAKEWRKELGEQSTQAAQKQEGEWEVKEEIKEVGGMTPIRKLSAPI